MIYAASTTAVHPHFHLWLPVFLVLTPPAFRLAYIHYTEELAASQDRIFSHSTLVSVAAIPQSIYLL
jgi:hypothetical protein